MCVCLGEISQMTLHTYHSRFIPVRVAEASQIFLRDAHVYHVYQDYLAISDRHAHVHAADVTSAKPITVLSQSISGANAIYPLVAFYDIHGREKCYSFILSRKPHETVAYIFLYCPLCMHKLSLLLYRIKTVYPAKVCSIMNVRTQHYL
jgi:hypothetical protein